jgi:hypothetical protein
MTANGVCSTTLPIPVRSAGAASSGSSVVLEYSNSKATTSRPMPRANPFTWRFAGVAFVPIKRVASAKTGVATQTSSAARIDGRVSLIPDDTIRGRWMSG